MTAMFSTKGLEDGSGADLFRRACRELAGGVTIITVGRGAARTGFTATSVTSLSVEPPTLIVCVNRAASSFPTLERERCFAVNIPSSAGRSVAERFAGAGGAKGAARYEGAEWSTLATGAPVLKGALAVIDCVVEEIIERHSHAIVIGAVRAVDVAPEGGPLLYFRGGYLAP